MNRWLKRALVGAAAGVALGVAGFVGAAAGVVPVNASGGHWAVTEAVLRFGMERSVAMHARGVVAPRLDDPLLVLKGAGHYELGCAPCHGSPSQTTARLARGSLPRPPSLTSPTREWSSAELFYIVKHGLKFTGMPAWPSQRRDDEVWAMVALLRALPTMSATTYRQLVDGANLTGEPLREPLGQGVPVLVGETCGHCHGVDGRGRERGAFPSLAGLSEAYLAESMAAYGRGARHSGIMEPIALELRATEQRELARYYAGLPSADGVAADAAAVERGAAIARRGVPARRVPACVRCHGPGGEARNPMYPALAGQRAEYLALQLEVFQRGQRGGSAYAGLMANAVRGMTRAEMSDVARYYASLGGR